MKGTSSLPTFLHAVLTRCRTWFFYIHFFLWRGLPNTAVIVPIIQWEQLDSEIGALPQPPRKAFVFWQESSKTGLLPFAVFVPILDRCYWRADGD